MQIRLLDTSRLVGVGVTATLLTCAIITMLWAWLIPATTAAVLTIVLFVRGDEIAERWCSEVKAMIEGTER